MNKLFSTQIDTPIGKMIAISDENSLYMLDFTDTTSSKKKMNNILTQYKAQLNTKSVAPLISIRDELELYFTNKLTSFKTPIITTGSEFQTLVWEGLKKIPYGQMISYGHLAKMINKPSAHRAAANANGANRFAILIPCHRVISNNGTLGGYAGGLDRKQYLLTLELRINDKTHPLNTD